MYHQCKLQVIHTASAVMSLCYLITGKTPPAQVAEVAQGQSLVRDCALEQAAIGCCFLLLLVPKMVLILATCAGGVFPFIM